MIDALASTEHLAVVSDFDGTLAGFARNAYEVKPEQRSLDALATLAELPNTTAAVLSGDDRFILLPQPTRNVRGFGDVQPVALSQGAGPGLEVDFE